MKQGDQADALYFIASGDCAVHIRDFRNRFIQNFKILSEGHIIGEIGV